MPGHLLQRDRCTRYQLRQGCLDDGPGYLVRDPLLQQTLSLLIQPLLSTDIISDGIHWLAGVGVEEVAHLQCRRLCRGGEWGVGVGTPTGPVCLNTAVAVQGKVWHCPGGCDGGAGQCSTHAERCSA